MNSKKIMMEDVLQEGVSQPTIDNVKNMIKNISSEIFKATKGRTVTEEEKDNIFNNIEEQIVYTSPIFIKDGEKHHKYYIVGRIAIEDETGSGFNIESCISIQTRSCEDDYLIDEEEWLPFEYFEYKEMESKCIVPFINAMY